MRELRDSTEINDDTQAMGARLSDDGYLFFRGLIDRKDIASVRRQVLQAIASHGWLDPDAPLDAAKPAAPERRTYSEEFMPGYKDVQRLEDMHRLAFHPGLEHVCDALYHGPNYTVPGKVVRIVYPGALSLVSPPHMDYPAVQVADMVVCWFPLGDCPTEMGGLLVLHGSQERPIPSTRPSFDPAEDWRTTDYRAGDVVLLHALTWHVGGRNRSDRLRISMDTRRAPVSSSLPRHMLRPDRGAWEWAELTDGWSSERWHEVPPEVEISRGIRPHKNVRHPDSRWIRLDPRREPIDTAWGGNPEWATELRPS